jgi:hypothetical protein
MKQINAAIPQHSSYVEYEDEVEIRFSEYLTGYVSDGVVTFKNEMTGTAISMLEWDFGNFVLAWSQEKIESAKKPGGQ